MLDEEMFVWNYKKKLKSWENVTITDKFSDFLIRVGHWFILIKKMDLLSEVTRYDWK